MTILRSIALVRRPHLDPGADSNSARANFVYGMKVVEASPEESVHAVYWASRLEWNPSSSSSRNASPN